MSTVLKARLLGVMRRELSAQEFRPSPYCERQIGVMVSHVVTRMRINNVVDQPSHIIRAEQNLRALVKYFSKYSRDVGTFPALSNSAFDTALNECPTLWPFRG